MYKVYVYVIGSIPLFRASVYSETNKTIRNKKNKKEIKKNNNSKSSRLQCTGKTAGFSTAITSIWSQRLLHKTMNSGELSKLVFTFVWRQNSGISFGTYWSMSLFNAFASVCVSTRKTEPILEMNHLDFRVTRPWWRKLTNGSGVQQCTYFRDVHWERGKLCPYKNATCINSRLIAILIPTHGENVLQTTLSCFPWLAEEDPVASGEEDLPLRDITVSPPRILCRCSLGYLLLTLCGFSSNFPAGAVRTCAVQYFAESRWGGWPMSW